jgi:hypothetical protein
MLAGAGFCDNPAARKRNSSFPALNQMQAHRKRMKVSTQEHEELHRQIRQVDKVGT